MKLSNIFAVFFILLGTSMIANAQNSVEEIVKEWERAKTYISAGMFLLATLGVAVNGMAFFKLGTSDKANIKAVRLHLLEDVMGWLAVIVGSVIIYFTGFTWIDPLLSVIIAIYILYNTSINLRSFTRIFLQGLPSGIDEMSLRNRLESIPGVVSLHDLHIWSMDGSYNILSVHLVVKDGTA